MPEIKPFLMSKTLWLNAIGLTILILQAAFDYDILNFLTLEQKAFILALLNIFLRFITDTKVVI